MCPCKGTWGTRGGCRQHAGSQPSLLLAVLMPFIWDLGRLCLPGVGKRLQCSILAHG